MKAVQNAGYARREKRSSEVISLQRQIERDGKDILW
jgi:hypothetical protein